MLVRIAQLKYNSFPNLERRVHKLINEDILPRARRANKQKVSRLGRTGAVFPLSPSPACCPYTVPFKEAIDSVGAVQEQ